MPLEYLVEVEKYHKRQFTGMENVTSGWKRGLGETTKGDTR